MDAIDIIGAEDLTSYPGLVFPTSSNPTKTLDLVNGLVTENWAYPNTTGDVPVSVKVIALAVFARAWGNPKGLASWTRSVDDGSRTERVTEAAARAGIFLTDQEHADLQRKPVDPTRPRRRYGTVRTPPGY